MQVKMIYPIIENACRQLEQYIDNRIDAGQTIFTTKDVNEFFIFFLHRYEKSIIFPL